MSIRKTIKLAPGFTSEIDSVSTHVWNQLLQRFADANIYQTWPYASVIGGDRNMSHLVLKRDGEVVAIAQARIARLLFINLGIAYVQWGPLWRRSGTKADGETFAQAIRALRNEFVCKRGLTLRLFPLVLVDDGSHFEEMLRGEGFSPTGQGTSPRTILMDLSPPLEDLREGMRAHWKRELKVGEKKEATIVEGSSEELFDLFIGIYKEMVSRKKFVEPNDINQFREIQAKLPEQFKMKIMLCRSGERVSSGVVCSALGDTAIYLFGATSDAGMKSRGSYLLQWKLIEKLKSEGITVYNLNGITGQRATA